MGATAIIGGLLAAASTVVGVKAAQDQKKEAKQAAAVAAANTPKFDAEAEKRKAAAQEAEANKKRVMGETDTIRTSALGNTGVTEVKKKTLLGG